MGSKCQTSGPRQCARDKRRAWFSQRVREREDEKLGGQNRSEESQDPKDLRADVGVGGVWREAGRL